MRFAADHNGIELEVRLWLRRERGHETFDAGSHDPGVVVGHPPLCAAVSRRVAQEEAELRIVIGGSGQGDVIACDKIRGVRAGLGDGQALALVELWPGTLQGRQHADREEMISELEITEHESAPEK